MRRILAMLLLVLLPLHLVWASAAVYCQHETSGQTRHFGHHDHQHHAGDAQAGADAKVAGDIDPDCGACHAGCVAALVGVVQLPVSRPSPEPVDGNRIGWASPPVAEPERPNWTRLA